MDSVKVLIIDDELLARDLVRSYLIDFPQVEIVGELSDGFQGIKAINESKPDLVFLDVQMPKLTGFEMLELLDTLPNIIFTTAYNEYAIKAFEHNAIDYLLKPFSKERFHAAVEKGLERLKNQTTNSEEVSKLVQHKDDEEECINRVVVKSGSRIHVIPVDRIRYIEAQDDYVMIYTEDGRHLKQKTMKYFQSHLDETEFCRIHRSFIVRVDQISQLEPYEKESWVVVLKKGEKLKVSRNGYKQLKAILEF
jgi:two-component system LytT family response regulator